MMNNLFTSSRRVLHHGLLLASLAFVLVGCASRPVAAPSPALSALPTAGPHTQRLSFQHADQRRELLGVLRHDERTLRLALLSPQGQRLLTLVRDDQGARFLPGAQFDPPFSADWLANRLAWSLWPADALTDAFRGSDWHVEVTPTGRTIRYRQRPVAHISGGEECRIIDDVEGGYRLQITPVDASNDRTQDACPAL